MQSQAYRLHIHLQERVLAALRRLLPGVDVKVGHPLAHHWGT